MVCVFVMAMAVGLFASGVEAGGSAGIKLGKPFEGELKTSKFAYRMRESPYLLVTDLKSLRGRHIEVREGQFYFSEVPVTLKAGQALRISLTVKGKGRLAGLTLLDPDRKVVAGLVPRAGPAKLKVEEVGATGKYTILVISNLRGAYTLLATGPREKEPDETELKEKIKELEEELANLKKKLKALQDKKREGGQTGRPG
jgi:hypothetical protein